MYWLLWGSQSLCFNTTRADYLDYQEKCCISIILAGSSLCRRQAILLILRHKADINLIPVSWAILLLTNTVRINITCRFSGHLGLSWARRGVDVACALEVDVFLNCDEVGGKFPHVFSIVYNAHHRVSAREQISTRDKNANPQVIKLHFQNINSHVKRFIIFISLQSLRLH